MGDKAGPHDWLCDFVGKDNVLVFETDKRTKAGDRLASIKLQMWMKSDKAQLAAFRENWALVEAQHMLEQWTPADYVICSLNAIGAHLRRFPAEPARIRFDPDDSVRFKYRSSKTRVKVPGSTESVPAVVGTVVCVPLGCVERGLPPEWKYAGWSTVHAFQGRTVEKERLFILDAGLTGWDGISNGVYTAVSRVRSADQIVRVNQDPSWRGDIDPRGIQAQSSATLIAARHKLDDRSSGRLKGGELTPEHVEGMIRRQGGKCSACGVKMLLQGFTHAHPQGFSIDRLDDSRGHSPDNVRVTCYRCNRNHRR